ncbi:MAG TPA: VOC family protein [Rhodospirillaceae bacterium]|nr:extradiol dioxygenase [Rhodospirillaceae bacterium]HAA91690.1 VOC family protein [Rhodospirillaceae bacterium]HAT36514.1 VOC family protein [Rhodospirillaceae bacterium]|tara:strand:- start:29 stop:451 length:423 start_codon:yes stop_codon:yes gene_type:complete
MGKARIKHIQLKVEDMDRTAKFYKSVFGFEEPERRHTRGDHWTAHLTDGTVDLACTQYDDEESTEALAHGAGYKIGHFGIEVEDLETTAAKLKEYGCRIVSPPGQVPIKFFVPGGGGMAEIAPLGAFKRPRTGKFKDIDK